MSVSGIGSSTGSSQLFALSTLDATQSVAPDTDGDNDTPSAIRSARTQFRSDFKSMLDAIKAGDMTAAQTAMTSVQNDVSAIKATYSTQSTPSTGQAPSDLQALFDAVKSGDATAAQQALAKLQTDAQQNAPAGGAQGHRHHHHHHQSGSDSSAQSSIAATATSPDSGTPSTSNTSGAAIG